MAIFAAFPSLILILFYNCQVGVTVFKISFGEVYRRIHGCREAVKRDFRTYIR